MLTTDSAPEDEAESLDGIVRELQELRQSADVSYGALVRRITAARIARGIPAAAAVPARSTVYNVFSEGRARMDTELLRDILLALGETDEEVARWLERCRQARRSHAVPKARSGPVTTPPTIVEPGIGERLTATLPRGFLPLFLLGCVAINVLGQATVRFCHLPVYLDMVGTGLAAIVLGPWQAVFVALATNAAGQAAQTDSPAFVLVATVGALIWGYGVRRFRMGQSLGRYFALNLVVAVACTLTVAPILVLLYGGGNGHYSDVIMHSMESMGLGTVLAVFSSNILTSLMDKLLSGFMMLTFFVLICGRFRIPTAHMPLVEKLRSQRSVSALLWGRPEARFLL